MGAAILIVEDEQNLADLMKLRLDDEGFQVTVAYTGAEAVKDIKQQRPDVITLDIHLPDANGLRMLEKIKANPETNTIPVIIISSSDEGDEAKSKGAAGYMRKPVNFSKLLSVLKGLEK
jgi:two-component system alkaline phosphatase synthesis response regulator PhoP